MAQYETNAPGVQAQKPSMVDKVKAKAEGLVEKITGHGHSGATTGTTTGMGAGGGNQGYGGQQNTTGSDPNYAQQQQTGGRNQGYGGQQDTGYGQGNQQPGGANPYVQHVQEQQQTGVGRHQQPSEGNTGYGQQNPSMMDKVKGLITPGHQTNTGHGTGTGYHDQTGNVGGTGTGTGTGTGVSTVDKIKNMIPGHHKTTGAGAGYN